MFESLDEKFTKVIRKHIKYAEYEDFILKNGEKSKYYVDIKSALLNPANSKIILKKIGRVIKRENFDTVCGGGIGGAILVGQLSQYLGKNGIIIRDEDKEYGLRNAIIGNRYSVNKVLYVEDVTTSGESLLELGRKLRSSFGKYLTVFNRGGNETSEKFGKSLTILAEFANEPYIRIHK